MKLAHTNLCAIATVLVTLMAGISISQADDLSLGGFSKTPNFGKISAKALAADWAQAPIKDYKALESHVLGMPHNQSPLNRLSEGALVAFLDSVVITPNGLGSFDPRPLRAELTPSEISEVLSLFGAQRLIPVIADIQLDEPHGSRRAALKGEFGTSSCTIYDYKCEAPATCMPFFGAICIYCNCKTP